ncbi:hypothetical protein D3C75_1082760 [compost metagenome]
MEINTIEGITFTVVRNFLDGVTQTAQRMPSMIVIALSAIDCSYSSAESHSAAFRTVDFRDSGHNTLFSQILLYRMQ